MRYKYLIHTMVSRPDSNGNTDICGRITSAKTGKTLFIQYVNGRSNISTHLRCKLNIEYHTMYETLSENIKKSEFNHIRRVNTEGSVLSESDITAKILAGLDEEV